MKKKLLGLVSLLFAFTMTAVGAVACGESDKSGSSSSSGGNVSGSVDGSVDDGSDSGNEEELLPSLAVSQKTLSVEAYASATLTAELKNSEADILWTSSDESVVKVVDGVVTAFKAGAATVTATAGELSDSCEVTVTAATEAVEFTNLQDAISIIKGTSEELDLALTYKGQEFTFATVSVATGNTNISIQENEVSALEYGEATVIVTAKVGDETVATKTITVNVIEFGTLLVDLPDNSLELWIGQDGYALSNITAQINGIAVVNPTLEAVSDNEEIVKVVDGVITAFAAGEAEVTVSYTTEMATYDTKINVTVRKESIAKSVNFLAKGNNEKTVAETGDATIDLSAAEIDLTKVTKVLCGETEVAFSVEGRNLTLTNAPGGYQLYTLVTATVDYVVDGTVYGYSISTAEELLAWRKDVFYCKAYTILMNDIDLAGAVLDGGADLQLSCTLDGRGYTISNFTFTETCGFLYYIWEPGTVKNVQFINVVQDCSGQAEGTPVKMGLFGDNVQGTMENLLLKMTVKNMLDNTDHYGAVAYYVAATAVMRNVLIQVEAFDCAPHYFYGFGAAGGGAPATSFSNIRFVCAGTSGAVTGQASENCGMHESVEDLLANVDFTTWGNAWQVIDGTPCLSDYSENEAAPVITSKGATTIGSRITFDTTSFYPLTYALAEEVTGVSINENNELVIGADATVGATITVNASCAAMPTFSKQFTFTIEKEIVNVADLMLAKGSAGKWERGTGTATIDLTDKGIDLANVDSVAIDGVAFAGYAISGNTISLTEAPGGDHVLTIDTAAKTYNVKICVYTLGISTVEELEEWRTTESYWYAVLLNDIDYKGETLAVGANTLGTLDGRGYKIKNFTYAQGFVKSVYDTQSVIKNIYFIATQDCTGMGKYPAYGLFGQWTNGTIENIYLDITTTNMDTGAEHIATICYGLEATATAKNIVVDLKNANGNFHYALNEKKEGGTTIGLVGGYEGAKGSSEGAGADWGVNGGFHAKLDWMIAEEANDELLSFTSAYWAIDTSARTITMKPW